MPIEVRAQRSLPWLCHTYSLLGVETYKQVSSKPIPAGDVHVRMLFEATETKPGTGGHVSLFINDDQVGVILVGEVDDQAVVDRSGPSAPVAAALCCGLQPIKERDL
jgi:hypothetical protein